MIGGQNIKTGVVFDIKKYAVDDGPGIRTTIFLKGCPLRCWWCHNPEGQVSVPELMYKSKRCLGCGECVKSCRKEALTLAETHVSIKRNSCNMCRECYKKCPTGALTIIGEKMSVEDLVQEIDKDAVFYDESDGGVTVSGGEPLFQLDFLNAILEKCKERHVSTAVDTCGYASHKAFDKIKGKVDLFLFDIKVMDDKKHRKLTGVSNKLILENLKSLAENGSRILVRLPVVPTINDDEDNIRKTAEFMASNGITNVSLLPYHRAGIEKYKSLGRVYKLRKVQMPSDQTLESVKERFEALGLKAKVGGG